MPVRKPTSNGRNTIGRFPSLKLNKMVAFESLIECDFIYYLEFYPEIIDYEEQPIAIEYKIGKDKHHYIPDFRVNHSSGDVLLFECKPEIFYNTEINQRKFQIAQDWCFTQGWNFIPVTDAQIRKGPLLENIKLLTYYSRNSESPQLKSKIFNIIETSPSDLTLSDLCFQICSGKPHSVLPYIYQMAFHHEIQINLSEQPISDNSFVSVCNKFQANQKEDNNGRPSFFNW